ncbi:hypothetical protein LOK49_LG04G03039 [Camellia lanceoleosa]|uniref:Uncharacterized protein n=1 Tax=Camellia lanceoleosa TaxID=1840588 RepID=A0ACC0HX22_9ERIC|nr:hypothetical protein LOK49_LG04G03039 [Camellia lanceoleosa]
MKHFLRSPLGVKTSVISEVIMGEGYLREIMGNYADVVFANSDEARAFCHFSSKESPASHKVLRHFVHLVSILRWAKGSYIGVKEAVYIPPSPCVPRTLVEPVMPMHREFVWYITGVSI